MTAAHDVDKQGGGSVAGGHGDARPKEPGQRESGQKAPASKKGARTPKVQKAKLDGVASSLRMVYQSAIDENVPNEMLDLLKRLG